MEKIIDILASAKEVEIINAAEMLPEIQAEILRRIDRARKLFRGGLISEDEAAELILKAPEQAVAEYRGEEAKDMRKYMEKSLDINPDLYFYSIPEAREMLHVGRSSIIKAIESGKLEAVKIAGRWKISAAALGEYVKLEKMQGKKGLKNGKNGPKIPDILGNPTAKKGKNTTE